MSQPFGRLPDGRSAQLVTLGQPGGLEVDVTDFGGIVTAIRVPGGAGGATDVALGFATLNEYLRGHPYFGAISRIFTQQIGVSVSRYRNSMRLERFLEYYRQPDRKTITEAVYAAGFGSYAQFHRVFTQVYGTSPREFLRLDQKP